MKDGKIQVCKECGDTRIHRAKGLCNRCYMKKYRKDHGIDGIAKIKTDAYEHAIEVVSNLLGNWGGRCRLMDNEVVIDLDNNTKQARL